MVFKANGRKIAGDTILDENGNTLQSPLIDHLLFGNCEVCVVIAKHETGMVILFDDGAVFQVDDRTMLKINKAIPNKVWAFGKTADMAAVPVTTIREALDVNLTPQRRVVVSMDKGWTLVAFEQAGDWFVEEVEPGMEEPLEEPIKCDSLSRALEALVNICVEYKLKVKDITMENME